MIRQALDAHATWLLRHPRLSLVTAALLTLCALFGLFRIEIDSDLSALLPDQEPTLQLLRTLEDNGGSHSMLLLLRGEDIARDLPAITDALSGSPFLSQVLSRREDLLGDTIEPGAALLTAPREALEELAEALRPEAIRSSVAATRQQIADDPALGSRIAKEDPLQLRFVLDSVLDRSTPGSLEIGSPHVLFEQGTLALIKVVGAAPPFDARFTAGLMSDLEQRLAGHEWTALGGYEIARSDAARIRGDMKSSLGWSIPCLFLLLALSTRSLLTPHLYLVPVVVGVLWAFGLGGPLLSPLSPLAVSAAAILMGLGVDASIHYLDHYRLQRVSCTHEEAIRASHREAAPAILASSATTIAAFLAIALVSSRGMASFGLLLALGLLTCTVAALTLLPPLLARWSPEARCEPTLVVRAAHRIQQGQHVGWLAGLLLLASLTAWAFTYQRGMSFESDPSYLRPADSRFTNRVRQLENALGFSPLAVHAWIPASTSPEQAADAIEDLVRRGRIARATGDLESVPGSARRAELDRFRERTAGWYAEAQQALATAGFNVERLMPALERLQAMLAIPDPGAPPPDFVWHGTKYREVDLFPHRTLAGRTEREALGAEIRTALGEATMTVDRAGIGDGLHGSLERDLRASMLACAVLVLVLVQVTLRSWRATVAALLPAITGLGALLAGLSAFGFPIHPGNLLALPLVLGFGVDDGIHLVHRWRSNGDRALLDVGTSLWRTTLTSLIGFGSLITAESPAIASLGGVAALGCATCFITTTLVSPALLRYVRA